MKDMIAAALSLMLLLAGGGASAQPGPTMYYNAGEERLLYEEPGGNAGEVRPLHAGEAFEYMGTQDSWARMRVITEAGTPLALWGLAENLRPLLAEDGFTHAIVRGGENGGPVRLRDAPSKNADSLGRYFPGVFARVISQPDSGWVGVGIGSLRGYMEEAELIVGPPPGAMGPGVPVSRVAYADGPALTMNAEQSFRSAKIKAYPNGTEVSVLGYTDDFAHVLAPDGRTGFLMGWGISPQPAALATPAQDPGTPPPGAYVTSVNNPGGQGAHLRERASTGSDSLGLYLNGAAVYVVEYGEYWTRVWADGRTGGRDT